MISKVRKNYTKTEKREIVSQSLEEDKSIKGLALRGVSENMTYNWWSQQTKNKQALFPGKENKTMTEHERKIAQLEKQLRERKLEVDILKNAVHIFSHI